MSNPDQIRADIESTRASLGQDVDALADKVTPAKIVDRQVDKVKSAFGSVRESVMGAASDARDSASSAAGSVGEAPHRAVQKAKGNPIAVGLIAFGVGWLASSLLPASEKEKELTTSLKESAQPLMSEVTDAAKQVGSNLAEPAKEAAQAVADTATDAVASVKSEASSAKDDVTSDAREAKHAVDEQRSS
jgi:gas vesicle protein